MRDRTFKERVEWWIDDVSEAVLCFLTWHWPAVVLLGVGLAIGLYFGYGLGRAG